MAGLLRQIQKKKPDAHRDIGDILIRPASEDTDSSDASKNIAPTLHSLRDVESTAHETRLMLREIREEYDDKAEELSSSQKNVSRVLKIVRRKNAHSESRDGEQDKDEDNSLPCWLTDSRKVSPRVEVLVNLVVAELFDRLCHKKEEFEVHEAVHEEIENGGESLREQLQITRKVKQQAEEEIQSIIKGKGPLKALYADELVTEIFIDNAKSIKVVRQGGAIETPFSFRSSEEYQLFLASMLKEADRELSSRSPIVDFVLDDAFGSRVNVIHPSLVGTEEPRVCIRIPRLQKVSFYDLLQHKTLPATLAAWLAEAVALREINMLIIGPAGSGKTVLTTALLNSVRSDERVVVIEEIPEIYVPTSHLEKLVTQPGDAKGQGYIGLSELVRTSHRRAPHRIVLGEVTDDVAAEFLRALEVGHVGSMGGLLADSAEEGLWRFLDLVMSQESAPQETIVRRISRSVDIVLAMHTIDGTPCLIEVAEVLPPVGGQFVLSTLVKYRGLSEGKREWQIQNRNSRWLERVAQNGMPLVPGRGLLLPDREESKS